MYVFTYIYNNNGVLMRNSTLDIHKNSSDIKTKKPYILPKQRY